MNDGTFLGQNRNPGINISQTKFKRKLQCNKIYSSPLKRSDQTAKLISKSKIIHDKNLLEINYGKLKV